MLLAEGVAGVATTSNVVEAFALGHEPFAAMLLLTVYVPGVDAETSIAPVEGLIDNPADELKVPPLDPIGNTGEGSSEL